MTLNSSLLKSIFLSILLIDSIICSLRPTPIRPSTIPATPPLPATPSPSTTCNVFPQVFGANTGDSFLNQIDVIGDYLAMAGDTNDKELTGETSILPYLAVMSVSKSGYFYWAKAFTAEQCFTIAGVQFSSDSSFLIAHSYSISGFIAVFNAVTGVLLSTRGYQIGGFQNYNSRVKSMVISGGTSPMAYILTNFKSSSSCSGQNFVRFNPLSFSTQAVWAKKTANSLVGKNCGHLGLVFGRGQSFLYAFSWFENKSTVSLVDIDGNYLWQQATQTGDPSSNNFISYKSIDISTDMVVATSGLDFINYNRIITSSSPPYYIQSGSQTYRDPNSSKTRQIRALYIQDQNIINSLIFDTVNRWTDLATIDFSISTITYQRTLPFMPDGMTNGVFVSPTVYYAGSNGYNFYQDQTSSAYQYLNINYWYQSIVYSSVTVPSSCYQLSTAVAQTPIEMDVLTLTPIKDPIYQVTSFSFKAYSASSSIIDIIVSKNTKIVWCLQSPFTISSSAQTSPINALVSGSGGIFQIDQFTAIDNCYGGYTNTFTYSGIEYSTGLPLNFPIDKIYIDPYVGNITVDSTKPDGTFLIKVVGTLPDTTSTFYVFNISIGSGKIGPYFETILQDLEAPLKQTTSLIFPNAIDPQGGTIQISVSNFIWFPIILSSDSTQLNVTTPHDIFYLGTYAVTIYLENILGDQTEYQFFVTVTNQAPVVSGPLPSQVNITFGQNLMYNLPSSSDPEQLPYTTSITYGPQYASIISNEQIRFNPIDCQKDLGYQEIYIKLEDEQPRSFFYSLTLFVDNKPPIFGNNLPSNQTVVLNTILSYQLPYFYDPEGCPVIVTFQPEILSSFVALKGDKLIYSPNKFYHVGDFEITVFLNDNQGLQSNATFWLTVFGPPKFIQPIPKKIDLLASNSTFYTLPIIPEIIGQFVFHLTKLPSFIKFNFPTYQFLPSKASDLGQYKIQGQLWDTHACLNFSFLLNVTNHSPIFLGNPLLDYLMIPINTTQKYQLPKVFDREGHTIKLNTYEALSSQLPQFVKFNRTSLVYTVSPTFLDASKSYNINIELSDIFDAVSSYTFKIYVIDDVFTTESDLNASSEAINQDFKASDKKRDQISFVNITLKKITRDQIAVISFYNSQRRTGIQQIIKQVSNNSFQAILNQSDLLSILTFEIVSKDTEKSQIQIKLNYPDNSNISVSQIPDSLKIVNLNRFNILGQQKLLIFLENTFAENKIPPQLSLSIENKVADLLKGGRFTFTNITPLNIFIDVIIQLIWSELEDFSFLTILTLIAVPIPGLPSTIQKVLIKLIFFDILYCELWLPQLMNLLGLNIEDDIENDDAVSLQFDETGFSYKQFLKNAGSSLLYIVIYIFAWVPLVLIQRLSSLFPRLIPFKLKLERQLIWNQSLSLLLSQFTPLFLCSIINFTYIRFQKSEKIIYSSAIFSIAVLTTLGSALIAIFIKVYQLSKDLNEISIKEFNEKYSKITEGLKFSKKDHVYYWKPLTLVRWIFTLGIVLVLNEQPALQMLLLILFSVVSQGLILTQRPYESPSLNFLSFFNELAVTIYLYLTLMLSDYMSSQLTDNSTIVQIRLILAWSIVILLMCVIFINCVYTYSGKAYSLFQIFKRRNNQVRYRDRVIRLKPREIQAEKPSQKINSYGGIQREIQIIDNERMASSNQYQFTFEETSYIKKEKYNDSMTKIMPETMSATNLNQERLPGQF